MAALVRGSITQVLAHDIVALLDAMTRSGIAADELTEFEIVRKLCECIVFHTIKTNLYSRTKYARDFIFA
jgi:hypothetical protein